MTMITNAKRALFVVVMALMCAFVFVPSAFAATSAVYTATTAPSYANPVTGQIEDSAGSSNTSLGESMTQGCTYQSALVEKDVDGNTFVTLRFKLADQIGEMQFWADNAGDGAFTETSAAQMQTGTADDMATADYRFQVPSESSNIRVSMYVTPMGRDVVYFVRLTNLVEGNTDAIPFVQTITPGEESPEELPVTESDSSEGVEAASTEATQNAGVQEFNADGQEVTGSNVSDDPLDGSTTALIVAMVAIVLVAGGLVAYFAYLKPKRARQASAAAAAAASHDHGMRG